MFANGSVFKHDVGGLLTVVESSLRCLQDEKEESIPKQQRKVITQLIHRTENLRHSILQLGEWLSGEDIELPIIEEVSIEFNNCEELERLILFHLKGMKPFETKRLIASKWIPEKYDSIPAIHSCEFAKKNRLNISIYNKEKYGVFELLISPLPKEGRNGRI